MSATSVEIRQRRPRSGIELASLGPTLAPRDNGRDLLAADEPSSARTKELLESTLNAMTSHVAILDGTGRIVLVNASWRTFLRAAGLSVPADGVGAEYLESGILGVINRGHAFVLRMALRAMLRGRAQSFQHAVCATQAGAERWYQISASSFSIDGTVRIVITHEDTSAIHAAQETIKDLSQRLLDLQEEERRRIAVELHDSTAQQLTAIGLYLITLRGQSSHNPATQRTLDEIERLIDESQREIRDFSYLLHPPYLDRDGLRTTLGRFVAGYARRTGLKATAQIVDDVDGFTPEVQRALLRIVQEALSNVHRHAAATDVQIRMKATARLFLFSVSDNGKGMPNRATGDATRGLPPGLGLPGMQARVRHLGGALRIISGAHGTTIVGKVPLSRCLG